MVTRVIQYFSFPKRPMKGGEIFDFYRGGISEKGGRWSRKGGYDHPYQLCSSGDDTRIWYSLNTAHLPRHQQIAFEQIYIWAEDINMLFNAGKIELLNFEQSDRIFYYKTPQGQQTEAKAILILIGNSISTSVV